MGYARFKINRMKRNGGAGYRAVRLNLTDLSFSGKTYVVDEEAYTCTLSAENGKYLPQIIDITGTKSRYAFKYDYTTGVIYIPSGEIIEDITITAVADTINNNIPAVMEVHTDTRTNTDGVNKYADETCLLIDVYPCRGSEVSVTFGGVTKTVSGDISTTNYDSAGKTVWFGTYLGQTDGVTATSGTLTISGAYESYSESTYINDKNTAQAYTHIDTITQLGAIRWLPVCFNKDKITFDRELDKIIAPYVNEGGDVTITFNNKVNIITGYLCDNDEGAGLLGGGNDSNITVYYNNIDWDWWSQGDRQYYGRYYQSGGDYSDDEESVTPYFNGVVYSDITEVPLSDKVTRIGRYAFHRFGITTLTLPKSVTRIDACAFYYCSKLTSLTIPDNVSFVGDSAFAGCNQLTDIDIGKCAIGESDINKSGIYSLYSLKSISVSPENELYCSINGILYSKNRESVICYPSAVDGVSFTVPQEVKAIKGYAFANSRNLESIAISNNVETIGEFAFYNCDKLKSFALPDKITRIEPHTFDGCSAVVNFSFSGKETYIGSYAFYSFGKSATSIVIPDSVTELANNAFYYCKAKTITVGSSVVKIGNSCFDGGANNVIMRPTTPPSIGSLCFSTSNLQITVPEGCAEVYKNAEGWSTYADYIVEASE